MILIPIFNRTSHDTQWLAPMRVERAYLERGVLHVEWKDNPTDDYVNTSTVPDSYRDEAMSLLELQS